MESVARRTFGRSVSMRHVDPTVRGDRIKALELLLRMARRESDDDLAGLDLDFVRRSYEKFARFVPESRRERRLRADLGEFLRRDDDWSANGG
jgi:hypothetical protein